MPQVISGLDQVVNRVNTLLKNNQNRIILAIVGKPGAGKSTLSGHIMENLEQDTAVVVPMDGFHLSNQQLDQLKRRDRKGAIDTFDVIGYLSLLERIKTNQDSELYFPIFYREIEESFAAAGVVKPKHKLVITEGNYLLNSIDPWGKLKSLFTESWYVDLPEEIRLDRLIKRHQSFGRSLKDATDWAKGTDQRNADLIGEFAEKADFFVQI